MSVPVVRAASRIVAACLKSARPVDKEVADGLRAAHALDDAARGQVVALVGRALRRRGLYERALEALPFESRREGLVLAALVDAGEPAPLSAADRALMARALDEVRAALDPDERARLASSVPQWLAPLLTRGLPVDEGRALLEALGDAPPLTLRANTLVTSRDALARALLDEGVATRPTAHAPHGLVVVERTAIHRTRAFRAGAFEIQDEGSQILAALPDARPGQVVVDACAGAGGKTLALAAAMENRGTLYAFDVHARRLGDLRARAKRAGVHNLRVHALDHAGVAAQKRLVGRADVVLVDAPCTGTGTLRRAPDIGWKLAPDDLARLRETQREILERAAPLVAPGGVLAYATCSLLREEDEAVVEELLARHEELTPVALGPRLAPLGLVETGPGQLRLTPHRHGTDGFFIALLTRRG